MSGREQMVGNDLKHLWFWTVTKLLYYKIWCLVSTYQYLHARCSFAGGCYCNKGEEKLNEVRIKSFLFPQVISCVVFLIDDSQSKCFPCDEKTLIAPPFPISCQSPGIVFYLNALGRIPILFCVSDSLWLQLLKIFWEIVKSGCQGTLAHGRQ